MSEDTAPTPESADDLPAETAPRVRRISNPRPKKTVRNTRTAAAAKGTPKDQEETPATGQTVRSPFPVFDSPDVPETPRESAPEEATVGGDWPDPEPPSGSTSQVPENPKRKRRRKKGKGAASLIAAPAADEESGSANSADPAAAEAATGAAAAPQPPAPRPQQALANPQPQPRVKFDPEALAKLAWKIYLSEVSEEGVALIGDNDAKELSRRCFRLAEIFLEEQARRR